MKNSRRRWFIMAAVMVFTTALWSIEIKNLAQAVNEAGRQRMLTQRMLKDYAMIGIGNTFGNPKEDLKKVMAMFEDHLKALTAFATDPETKKSLEEQRKLWEPIKKMLSEPPTKERAIELQGKLDALLKAADRTTKLFAKQTGQKSGKIINISGRQRMLSQRMANLYMLKVWGINDPQFKEKMAAAMKLFNDSLNLLIKSDLNTDQINKLLKRVKQNFMFFQVMNRSQNRFIPSLIYKKSNEILKDMNTVTGLYASQKVQ
ncbi:type IV pili methyl-accepting chemotaxis transducer N-terminal domain-containing protein [Nitratifractor sp.]|uniref:type IV pili methyl-accepting chemotaxis transducer N-terminal domain-containing protein n=1 Tax=Nitratifractor sp. TaxID=2268144 RepID=UPI0025E54D9B|nr:type IV pili methyl-accepting chemotaxis transducer N-terminal domain-containing protein [Nitratifractor sp.]